MNKFSRILAASLVAVLVCSMPAGALLKKKHTNKTKPTDADPTAGLKSKQPDKELFDKALLALKKGKFDVARLDLQTLLNTYPESEYQMRAKLAIGDSWFKEGGTAALTQAETEYKDFITFFPNQPEAAEAQMKVADIYYMQMEKPDRDFNNVVKAEQEYRNMINQYPDSTLIPRAKQKLREVQEVMADREFEIGSFYATRGNYAGAIARLQTVADTYPLFSHSDMTLLNLGDAYAAEARAAQNFRMQSDAKQQLIGYYNDRAAEAYDRVVTRYPLAAHVEDARDRLIALNRSVPEPTAQQIAENEAEVQSRVPVKISDRALMLVKRGPRNTVEASRVGEPNMDGTKRTLAPDVTKASVNAYMAAVNGKPLPADEHVTPADVTAGTAVPHTGDVVPPGQVNMEDNGTPAGTGVGATIIGTGAPSGATNPSEGAGSGASGVPGVPEGATPPDGGAGAAVPSAGNPFGIKPVENKDAANLPPVEKPATAPDTINDAKTNGIAQVQTGNAGKKKEKVDLSKESSSKKKKKKGLDKLNPF
jgi:outer membrane protein assembly factor BamD